MSIAQPIQTIILIGFSTTGKSTIGRRVAERLGWSFRDTDDLVAELAGKPIAEIFGEDGEDHFRDLETSALERACGLAETVVATGGGVILRDGNRRLMAEKGFVVCLEAKPETIHRRLLADAQQMRGPVIRPLLAGDDPLARIRFLKEFRQPFYAVADWTIHTDYLGPEEVADEILRGWDYFRGAASRAPESALGKARAPFAGSDRRESDAPYCEESGALVVIETSASRYPVFVDWGNLAQLGRRMRNAGLARRTFVIADEVVANLYWPGVRSALEEAGIEAACLSLPSGEAAKSLIRAEQAYNWLLDHHAERGHSVIALGGGVAGDFAGFVAATFQRGMAFVQVPTTMLAMVDSSLGGKVAVNLPRAKNMVGAFHQPRLVLADVSTLASLPEREMSCGWAETIKHGLIADPDLLGLLETHGGAAIRRDPVLLTAVVRRSAMVKAAVVAEDEREADRRLILNYGHTLGHALEASLEFEGLLHGEAVAVGMIAAAWVSHLMGLVPEEVVRRHERVLQQFALPVRWPTMEADKLLSAMAHDKKVRESAVRWVLLTGIGQTVVRADVPREIVEKAIAKVRDAESCAP